MPGIVIRRGGVSMLLQISSGQGPVECEYAVGLLFRALQKEYPDIEMLYQHPGHAFCFVQGLL